MAVPIDFKIDVTPEDISGMTMVPTPKLRLYAETLGLQPRLQQLHQVLGDFIEYRWIDVEVVIDGSPDEVR